MALIEDDQIEPQTPGITNSAPQNTLPKSADGDGNLEASQITDDGTVVAVGDLEFVTPSETEQVIRTRSSVDNVLPLSLKGGSSTNANGANVNVSGGDSVNGEGGAVTLFAGGGGTQGGGVELAGGDVAGAGVAAKLTLAPGGVAGANGAAWNLRGGDSAGTNIGGDESSIKGTASTGNAVGGSITFHLAGPGASGTDVNNQTLRGEMSNDTFTWDGVLKLTPRAFAALPAAPSEGMMAWVNDSNTATWGATVAGGGANKILAVYNGTVWTVAGK